MSPAVDTITFANGLVGEIHHDPDVERPYANNAAVRIVILSRRYNDPSGGACGTTPAELAQWTAANSATWWIIPLFFYEHGAIVYQPADNNPFHCTFDSGRAGSIALRRDSFPADKRQLRLQAEEIANRYSQWSNGECYRFTLNDANGKRLESAGGIIGYDEAVSLLNELAASFTERSSAPAPQPSPKPEQGLLFEAERPAIT
jgi:hypothetical protein